MLGSAKITSILIAALTIVSSVSCVKNATETKAKCGQYEAFDSVSRSCYSLSTNPTAPVGTLTLATLEAEVAKKIRISYTDANSDLALSCRANATSGSGSNIQVASPALTDGSYVGIVEEVNVAMTNLYYALPGGYAETVNALTNLTNVTNTYSTIHQSFNFDLIKGNDFSIRTNVSSMLSNAQSLLSIIGPSHAYSVQIRSNIDFLTAKQEEYLVLAESVVNNCICDGGECYTTIVPKMGYYGTNGFSYSVTDKDGTSSTRPVTVTVNPLSPVLQTLRPITESFHISLNEENTNLQTTYTYSGLNPAVGRNLYSYQPNAYTYTFKGTKVGCIGASCYGQTYRGGRISGCLDLIGSSGPTDRTCSYSPINNNDNNFIDSVVQVPLQASNVIDLVEYTALEEGSYGNEIQLQFIDVKSLTVKDYDSFATPEQLFGLVDLSLGESFIRVEGNRIKVFINDGITTRQNIVSLINSHVQASRMITAQVSPADFGLSNSAYSTSSLPINLANGNDGYDHFAYAAHNGISESENTANVSISLIPRNDPPRVPSQYVGECTTPEMTTECIYSVVNLTEGQVTATNIDLKFRDVDINTASSFTLKKKVVAGTCSPSTVLLSIDALTNSAYFDLLPTDYPDVIASADFSKFSHTVSVQPLSDFNGAACLYYQVTDAFGAISAIQGVSLNVNPVNDPPMLGDLVAGVFTEFDVQPTINLSASFDEDFMGANVDNSFIFYSQAGGVGGFENNQTMTFSALSSDSTVFDFSKKCETGTPDNVYLNTANYRCYKAADNSLFSSVTIITDPVPLTISGVKTLRNRIIFVPKKDQSGVTEFTLTVEDGGETPSLSTTYDFSVNVNYVDDPPYFMELAGENLDIIESNEGGMIQTFPFRINEDEGDTVSEDYQGISIVSITSDNAAVLPSSSITAFYDLNGNGVEDLTEARLVGDVLETNAADDAKLHRLFLKLKPISGSAGSTNITLTISDGLTNVSHNFSYVVRPIASIHRGWANISSVGIKTNKLGAPVEVALDASGNTLTTSDLKCNFNKTTDTENCNGGNCLGSAPPNSVVTASAKNVLYWDANNKKCYRSNDANNYSWVEFNTSCPITRQTGSCGGENCIIDSASGPAITAQTPTFIGEFKYDLNVNTCYRAQDVTAASWTEYVPSKVTLAWKPFTITGLGIYSTVGVKGYNVYRRETGRDYDFGVNGHLTNHLSSNGMSVSGASIRTFTDTTAIAGKVYYYIVRPVDSIKSFPTFTSETFSEVRLVAAPENYAFVHRWMVNQEICSGMNMTESPTPGMPHTIDPNKNYTCPYVGPGRTVAGGESFYDYGRDLLVDIQESGCAYAQAPKCSGNGCVGRVDPAGLTGMDHGDMYYNRSTGSCFAYDIDNTWKNVNTASVHALIAQHVGTALNPPLVNVSKMTAQLVCEERTPPTLSGLAAQPGYTMLPNKKDYMGYSAHKVSMEYSEDIKSFELGMSLNNASACNGSYANGLQTSFTNTDVPLNSFMFSIAGTDNSQIRSLHTGSVPWGVSKSTNECVSRYGIQDLYGNVSEWLNDSVTCSGTPLFICSGNKQVGAPSMSTRSFYEFEFGDSDDKTWAIDGIVGPGPMIEASLPVAFVKHWALSTNQYNASLFNYPLGLPITDAITTYDGSNPPDPDFSQSFPWLININSSNSKINDDGFVLYRDSLISNPAGSRDIAAGGSFKTDSYPGRFTTEFIGQGLITGSATQRENIRNDVGFRCAVPIESTSYPNSDPYHTYEY